MKEKKLAIIVPAYKLEFFYNSLSSISAQTCKDFIVYVGDDNSPSDLHSVVKKFDNKLNIVYYRFKNNLGSYDLVAHWKRCINLSQNESWLWLFSDDDIMSPNCVEDFYNFISKNKSAELLHFDTKIIDKEGYELTSHPFTPFPETLDAEQYYKKRLSLKLNSFVVEYIFKRSLYEQKQGFEYFDLAWCSDDATWIKFSVNSTIFNIPNSLIFWRYSGINVSSHKSDFFYRKIKAKLEFIRWADEFFCSNSIPLPKMYFIKVKWLMQDIVFYKQFTFIQKIKMSYKYSCGLHGYLSGVIGVVYFIFWFLKNIKNENYNRFE